MTMYYTIQNEKGDLGFIQRIEYGLEYDDVNEYSIEFNTEYAHCYNVISKHEYDVMLSLINAITIESVRQDEMYQKYSDMYDTLLGHLLKTSKPLVDYLFSKLD